MRQNAWPEALEGSWNASFPGQIPDRLVIAEELDGHLIDLEGHGSVISIALRLSGHRRPRDEQFGAVRQLLDDGIIRHAGLSEVSVADIDTARQVFPVATVQNR